MPRRARRFAGPWPNRRRATCGARAIWGRTIIGPGKAAPRPRQFLPCRRSSSLTRASVARSRTRFNPGIGRTHQRGKNHRLHIIQALGFFGKQSAGGCGDALKLAAKSDKVQIGLENFSLGPGFFQRARRPDLPGFLKQRPAAFVRLQVSSARSQLHRDGAGAARPGMNESAGKAAAPREIQSTPPCAVEPVIFSGNDRGLHGRGDPRRDVQSSRRPLLVDPHFVKDLAVAVEQDPFGLHMGSADLGIEGECREAG